MPGQPTSLSLKAACSGFFIFYQAIGRAGASSHAWIRNRQSIVWTADVARAEHFYRAVLQLPLKGSYGALVFEVGRSELRVAPMPGTRPSEHTVLGFAVQELATVLRVLSERGIAWERFDNLQQNDAGVLRMSDGTRTA